MGPTLFNIFINDLFIHVTQTKLNTSVGDHQIYHSNVDPLVLDRYISNDVEKANQWYSQNGMIVNAKKRQALIIDQTEHKFSFPVKCELDIFVMTIDNRLNFDKHISAVCNKINDQFNVMLRFSNISSIRLQCLRCTTYSFCHTFTIVFQCGIFVEHATVKSWRQLISALLVLF